LQDATTKHEGSGDFFLSFGLGFGHGLILTLHIL
jgi:hypothetical protein